MTRLFPWLLQEFTTISIWGIIINIHRGTSWEELLLDWARKPGGWCSVATGTVMISRSGLSAANTEPVPSKPITRIPGLKPEKNFRPKLNQLLVIWRSLLNSKLDLQDFSCSPGFFYTFFTTQDSENAEKLVWVWWEIWVFSLTFELFPWALRVFSWV